VESARHATNGDLERVARLWTEAVDELDRQRGGPQLAGTLLADSTAGPAQPEAWLQAALSDPDRTLVVGLLDDEVFGFAVAHLERRRRIPIATVDMLHVEPGAREVGVGEAMLEHIVTWAATQGAAGVDAPALPGSRAAKGFFESHGFTARLLTMHRPLPS
jgi:GNAT superfamily N-acetyltransferase